MHSNVVEFRVFTFTKPLGPEGCRVIASGPGIARSFLQAVHKDQLYQRFTASFQSLEPDLNTIIIRLTREFARRIRQRRVPRLRALRPLEG